MANPSASLASRWRQRSLPARELTWLAAALLVGLIVVPLGVHFVGMKVLGPYPSGGLGDYLRDYYAGLGRGLRSQWILVLGPYVLICIVRLAVRLGRTRSM